MHPEFGLWHAYRAALLLETEISIQRPDRPIHHCDACVEKPCLSACPVDAFSGSGFDAPACRGYLATGKPSSIDSMASTGLPDCLGDGCAARNACPVAGDYRYGPEQMRFHMAAFARA
jgi:epoxyqueuosine reductase QueG